MVALTQKQFGAQYGWFSHGWSQLTVILFLHSFALCSATGCQVCQQEYIIKREESVLLPIYPCVTAVVRVHDLLLLVVLSQLVQMYLVVVKGHELLQQLLQRGIGSRTLSLPLYYTVEPPNKGHFGNEPFVLCLEVVPILLRFDCIIPNII